VLVQPSHSLPLRCPAIFSVGDLCFSVHEHVHFNLDLHFIAKHEKYLLKHIPSSTMDMFYCAVHYIIIFCPFQLVSWCCVFTQLSYLMCTALSIVTSYFITYHFISFVNLYNMFIVYICLASRILPIVMTTPNVTSAQFTTKTLIDCLTDGLIGLVYTYTCNFAYDFWPPHLQ